MVKKIKQFRFYDQGNSKNTNEKIFFTSNVDFSRYMPIVHLGIQTLPGTKVYLNSNMDAPVIIGATGIYELDLEGTTGLISSLQFDPNSMNIIEATPTGYLIVDIIYEVEED